MIENSRKQTKISSVSGDWRPVHSGLSQADKRRQRSMRRIGRNKEKEKKQSVRACVRACVHVCVRACDVRVLDITGGLDLSHGSLERDFQKMRENRLSERRVLRTHLCPCEPEACAQCHKCEIKGCPSGETLLPVLASGVEKLRSGRIPKVSRPQ